MLEKTFFTQNGQTVIIERSFGNAKTRTELLCEYVREQYRADGHADGKRSDTDADWRTAHEKKS